MHHQLISTLGWLLGIEDFLKLPLIHISSLTTTNCWSAAGRKFLVCLLLVVPNIVYLSPRFVGNIYRLTRNVQQVRHQVLLMAEILRQFRLLTCCIMLYNQYKGAFHLGNAGVCPLTKGWQPLDGGRGSFNKNWHSRHNAGCVGPCRTMGRCHGVMARLCLQRLWTYKMCSEERTSRISEEHRIQQFYQTTGRFCW